MYKFEIAQKSFLKSNSMGMTIAFHAILIGRWNNDYWNFFDKHSNLLSSDDRFRRKKLIKK